MPIFSHSRLSSFETCPLQYKYHYLDRIKVEQEDTVETFLGSRAHEAMEKLYKDLKFEKLLSLKELLSYFNRQWKENWNSTIKINRKEYSAENYRKIGERCITDYYMRYSPFNQAKVLGLETMDYLQLDREGKYRYHVRIDRLMDMGNGVYEVHDYKTNNTMPRQEYLDKDRQLAMYSLWVKKQFRDFKKVRLVWHFLSFDKEMESSRSAKELEDLRKEVLAEIKKIESCGEFSPSVSKLCDWCAYQEICPMWKHEIKLRQKPANEYLDEPGVRLVNKYVRVKEDQKELDEKIGMIREAIIAFARKEGINVIVGSDNKITIRESENFSFPRKNTPERQELIQLLKDMHKFTEVAEPDIYALSKILREEAWDKGTLSKLKKFAQLEKTEKLSVSKKHE